MRDFPIHDSVMENSLGTNCYRKSCYEWEKQSGNCCRAESNNDIFVKPKIFLCIDKNEWKGEKKNSGLFKFTAYKCDIVHYCDLVINY